MATSGSAAREQPARPATAAVRSPAAVVQLGHAPAATRTGSSSSRGTIGFLLDAEGAGSVNHIWIGIPEASGYREARTGVQRTPTLLQRLVLEMRWDGEEVAERPRPARRVLRRHPRRDDGVHLGARSRSVPRCPQLHLVLPHAVRVGRAGRASASESDEPIRLWFYVDYEQFDHLEPDIARFHATWNRQRFDGEPHEEGRPTRSTCSAGQQPERRGQLRAARRRGARPLRRLLPLGPQPPPDARVELVRRGRRHDLHRRCRLAAGPPRDGPRGLLRLDLVPAGRARHAVSRPDPRRAARTGAALSTYYRFHIEDPVLVPGVDQGLDRARAREQAPDELTSVAFWYQAEPHRPLTLPAADERVPRPL